MKRSQEQPPKYAARLKTALELQRCGVAMMHQNLRRRFPSESDVEISRRLNDWLRDRPGAEFGDGVGRPVAWPRTNR